MKGNIFFNKMICILNYVNLKNFKTTIKI